MLGFLSRVESRANIVIKMSKFILVSILGLLTKVFVFNPYAKIRSNLQLFLFTH